MTSRRTDGLAVLARLKRHETENVALEMAEVNRALGLIEAERQALMEQLNDRGDPDPALIHILRCLLSSLC